ncbi:glycoside hydrolase family 3 N-terminal domain-containing protein [Gandjariella thermophila]|uniref:beta-N-acetylhexosaminidase n=1 Tax=Gandjariella thermophila TaxID=1931992 RepID=A0A4D4JDT5_9PSEU|nr:glycoside hydrolase family 3 N-terminal domain-containing protein [Gandjariella thermophila]GDY32067.1 beta-N-acetylhexosaminidase [Gandjariella thermophila]
MTARLRILRWAVTLLAAVTATACATGGGVPGTPRPHAAGPTAATTIPSPSARSEAEEHASAVASCVRASLTGMDERTRAGQLFVVGVPATGPGPTESAVLGRYGLGGVFLVGRGRGGVDGVAHVADAVQRVGTAAAHGVGLFVAADQEGGEVQVLSGPGFSDMPSAAVQGRWPPDRLRAAASQWGRELRAAGVNLNLAPVGDVLSARLGAANAPIGRFDRAFGTDPATVAAHVTAFVQGMQDAGVATTVKHFPGLGRVTGNTDFSAGVTDAETSPNDPALGPFGAAVRAGTTFVMSSSATYPRLDPAHRAVFSPAALRGLVRGTLGFSGLIVSDDLGRAQEVAAVPVGERAVDFLAAGGDVVLTADPNTVQPMVDAVVDRAHRDPGFADAVAASERRVLTAKADRGLLPCGAAPR